MSDLARITDVTDESFQTLVIERSRTVPVLVDYWADWCGPCQMQMPVLQKLVDDYDGKFVLAKVNTDEQRELARAHNIRSLPTMRVYKDGELAEEILAAQTETSLRVLLDRYIERPSDTLRGQAWKLFADGEQQQALTLLRDARQGESENHQLTLDYAELCYRAGKLDETGKLLDELPRDVRDEPEAMRLRALLDFARCAPAGKALAELESAVEKHPDDTDNRYRLGCAYVMDESYDEALETFMHILKHDRSYRDDAGRKALLSVLNLLGDDDSRVAGWRRRMFNTLH